MSIKRWLSPKFVIVVLALATCPVASFAIPGQSVASAAIVTSNFGPGIPPIPMPPPPPSPKGAAVDQVAGPGIPPIPMPPPDPTPKPKGSVTRA